MTSTLRQLVSVLSSAVDSLEKTCAANGMKVPDLNEPFSPPSEAFRKDAVAAEAASVVTAAAMQLAAIVTPPQISLYHCAGGHFRAAAVRVCMESNVTEILREAGPQGLHVKDICTKNGQDPEKLVRFMRFLATNHIYREVTPEVFANTRISSMMDTLKPSSEMISSPESKHDNTHGMPAFTSHHLDEGFKSAAWAWEVLADPTTRSSGDISHSPFSKAFNTSDSIWKFYEHPENRFRHKRFGIGMQGVQSMQPADAILTAYDWKSLPEKSVVVDVGGGVGTSTLALAGKFPQFNYVVQDLPGTIEDAKTIWDNQMPDAIASGRVKLEAHDFFKPQPQTNASIFLLKFVCHDWSDQYCVKFLSNLRQAATPKTTLLVLDSLIPLACRDSGDNEDMNFPGAKAPEAPEPLLANYGVANEMCYNADINMFLLFNAQERTLRHFKRLFASCGWRLTRVNRQDGDSTFIQAMEAVPA
ncbi:S-adenosyl-L-methionine-dependent methyltransferase [Stereum hirsutum FP-91666 SS1]|uniref:S-adenosyl-L-methionine-dependent methyltransferase n=1 Tax=Stereum hirsutum (strain FP-91666) TaxID=721885 RepID=UPI000440DD12|nr:S-adenosyl-L-methionine-dependent methyltransferase [Stereum hirsutum FP-91666 SS1]EIM90620.1 S-adenosyl-L-methionine-dependent methyltransferase [Stereum hirsutum FP-91666 SS1]